MKRWISLDAARTPGGKTISLHQHDRDYAIRVDGVSLMSTRTHASEDRVAELACAHAKQIRSARVLIGGLGFGFTLSSALAALAPDAKVVVAEILAAVVAWNRNPLFPLAGAAMTDPRVTVVNRDVVDVIRESTGGFDSIVLDVDNGPAALSDEGNRRLYDLEGLRLTLAALRPGGCAAFWSAAGDAAFEKLIARAGFEVEVERCRAHANGGSWHTLFLGRRK